MADIFISYSQKDPEPTKALAADLEARGYTTWWDTSLLPGERFPDKIRQELEAAKVVIVIWSENSVKSTWVQAEAQIAHTQNKLITVCVPGFDVSKVPLPYNVVNIEPVTNRGKLYATLETRGVKVHNFRSGEDAEVLYRRGIEYYYGMDMWADCNSGDEVTQDYDQAARLFRKAADMGHVGAICNLGLMYRSGQGVAQDHVEAVRLYRKAADVGSAAAAYYLAISYKNGEGVEKSREEARRWYRRAADLGNPKAAEALKRLDG